MNSDEFQKIEEPYFNWRALAGYAYILICIFDFLIMPASVHFNKVDTQKLAIVYMDKIEDHNIALKFLDRIPNEHWEPVTMFGGGLFHLSFGAILTGAAVTRGFERREMVRQNGNSKH